MVCNKTLKFVLKLLSLIICICTVIGIADYYYVRGYYYTDVYGEVKNLKNIPEHLTYVNVGTSHGLSCFDYKGEAGCFNLALSGSDIYHNFMTLKQFSSHFEKDCIIAIPVSYFSFCVSTDEPSQKRYYHFLDKKYIRDFSYEILINAKYLPVLRSGEFAIKDIIHDAEIDVGGIMMSDDEDDLVINSADNPPENDLQDVRGAVDDLNSQLHEQLLYHAKGRAVSWRSGNFIPHSSYINSNIDLLVEMINWCRDSGFRPVLLSTPIYRSLNEQFTEEELNRYYFDNINAVITKTGIQYIDLSHDEQLSFNPEYFANSDHMNDTGAEAFMNRFDEFLRSIGYKK